MLTLRFDQPLFLLLGLLAIPLVILGWRALRSHDALRRATTLALRTVLLLAMVVILAGPQMQREHDHLTVIGLLDISGSVQRFGPTNLRLMVDGSRSDIELTDDPEGGGPPVVDRQSSVIQHMRQWFRAATDIKEPDDRFGLVVFDGQAVAISAPTRGDYIDDNLDLSMAQGTNIENAVRLGLAMFPPDTARRLVLVTDGNETAGNVREAIRAAGRAGANVPIDVVPIAYRVTNDVQVLRVESPPSAQPGQTVTVRIVLESTQATSGRLTLRREGEAIDLSPGVPGPARRVTIPAGQSVHLAQVALGHSPVNRFIATFEADDPTHNILPDNDRAEAFTLTPSRGSVLVLDSRAGQRENLLGQMLEAADIPVEVQPPVMMPEDLLALQNHDLVILDNIAAYELTQQQQQLLTRYVNDLGGGLIMSGGENSFGAGGWLNTPVAGILPVNLEPTKELRMPTAAVVLVVDNSGSMNAPVAGARMTQQAIANEACALAIETLHAETMVGVITFNHTADVLIPLQRNQNPRQLAERVRTIMPGGGTHFTPALREAHQMLRGQNIETKRVIFISDGVSADSNYDHLIDAMVAEGVQITTISVGDEADHLGLQKMAERGGGSFHIVRDPRTLPRVLVESVRIINKPLLKEVSFTPRVLPTGSPLTIGMESAPPLQGLVITSPREDARALIEMTDPDGEPLLAHWQAGLGRVAAFTSEAPGSGDWARHWIDWPTAFAFWTQLARTISRPAMSQEAELIATVQDEHLHIAYEMNMADESSGDLNPALLDYLQVDGTVYRPDGGTVPVRLRQSAPGRYEAMIEAPLAGNYIVALNPRQGTRQLAPAIGGANRSTSPEFRRYVSNLALLEEIVQTTGGRRLNIENPLASNLFDRLGMPPSISLLPIWWSLLWWVLVVLLLDVACRRLAWDYNLLRRFVQRAMERVVPARVRGAEAAATLATLRKVSDDVEQRREAAATGVTRFRPTGRIAPPPPRDLVRDEPARSNGEAGGDGQVHEPDQVEVAAEKVAASVPDPSRLTAALDAFLGRTKKDDKPPPSAAPSKPDEPRTTDTSSLLAAKRRAKQRMEGEGEKSP